METHGLSHPLFVVKGSCHGLEIGLDSSHVPFGAVVLNSQSIRRILMINSGDIGARYVDQNQYGDIKRNENRTHWKDMYFVSKYVSYWVRSVRGKRGDSIVTSLVSILSF